MSLLYSKIQPLIYDNDSFAEAFETLLLSSDQMKIASGYISEESLMELKSVLDFYKNEDKIKSCDLIIGMHHREGFTRPQYEAAKNLAEFLAEFELGAVRVCTAFKFHGKVYSFFKDNAPFASIMGSSNLSNMIESRQWEVDYIFRDDETLGKLDALHADLVAKATKNILDLPKPEKFNENQGLLEGRTGVEKLHLDDLESYKGQQDGVVFEIPLKAEAKSNLNTYFGKGRQQPNGAIRPRPWYEVEIIVPTTITRLEGYPHSGTVFNVITDDGWKFKCKISGQNDKNLRSEDDLKTLGRWIKGRLEAAGILQVGQPITAEMLEKYGRNNLTLSHTKDPETWLLDFSVNKTE
jgi:hypothetical protein